MIPRIRRMKWVSGSTSASHCTARGMPANGNMKPDSRNDGRNTKNVICIAWNCDCARVLISSPRVRLATHRSIEATNPSRQPQVRKHVVVGNSRDDKEIQEGAA